MEPMELTEEMIVEIRKAARQADYGKVLIEIENRGNEPSLDIVVTARKRFQKAQPSINPNPTEKTGTGYRN
jgi:hypothetical protein